MTRANHNKIPTRSNRFIVLLVALLLFLPLSVHAVEVAPRISDREIIERLTRLEEGQITLRNEVKLLRDDMSARFASMDAQFDRLTNIMIAIVAAFAAVAASTIGFAVWDRRTMIRPFETKVKAIEEAFSENRQQVHALVESMKALSQRDEQVAAILRKFHLI
jgi:hypothetical protein